MLGDDVGNPGKYKYKIAVPASATLFTVFTLWVFVFRQWLPYVACVACYVIILGLWTPCYMYYVRGYLSRLD